MRRTPLIFALMLSGQAFGQIVVLPKVQVPVATFADRFVLAGTATDDGWAMVWTERDGIYGALLDKEAKHFGKPVQISTEPPNDRISVGWSGTRLLVAWIDGPNTTSGTLRIRRVLNGEPEGDEQVIESNAASVKVAGSAYGALLVWTAATEVHALRFNRDAASIDQSPVRVDANSAEKGAVYAGAAGESYVIAWVEADKNPNYPCRFYACAHDLDVRMVACHVDSSGPKAPTTLRSHIPSGDLDYTGPYPEAFAWSPQSGLLLWDDSVATLLIPVSEELLSRAPIIEHGFPNAQFDGRNFVVCISHTSHPDGGIFVVVSQFGDSFIVFDDVVVPYAQLVAGNDGQVLLAWTSGEQQGITTVAYAAVGIDYWTFPTGRRRAVGR